jgi:hypothetical protein
LAKDLATSRTARKTWSKVKKPRPRQASQHDQPKQATKPDKDLKEN